MGKEIAIKGVVAGGEVRGPACFRLLGAFDLTVADQPQWPGPEQVQRLLVKLLAAKGMPVANDELMRAIWDEIPGRGATTEALHHLVVVARRILTTAGLDGVLVNGRGTYRLDVPAAQVDVHRFNALTARARELDRKGNRDAVLLLEEALRLRAGEPLAGLRGDWVDRYRLRLVEELGVAEQAMYESAIRHGEAHERLPGLGALHRDRPDDERVTWLCMHALYRDGRQLEALELKRAFERQLRDEYGMDCGKALDDLAQRILRQDAALLTPEAVSFPAGETGARVRGLGPLDPGVGREGSRPEPDRPPTDPPPTDPESGAPDDHAPDDHAPDDHAAARRREEPAAAGVTNEFNAPVDARYAVFGPQFNYGAPR